MAAALAAAAAVVLTATAASAAPVTVRVEGAADTLFYGPLDVAPAAVDGGDGTGPHGCGGAGEASALAALGRAASAGGFEWRGRWNPDFQDFFVDRIGPDASQAGTASYWALLVDWRYAGGGCATPLRPGAEVLWAYDTANRPVVLRLTGPGRAAVGERVTVQVRDGWVRLPAGHDGGPVAGAHVGGSLTDGAGHAHLTFNTPGLKRLRAERSDAIRSNVLELCVGDSACVGTVPPGPPPPAREGPEIARPLDGSRYARGAGPRNLGGSAGAAATVVLTVEGSSGPRRNAVVPAKRGTWRHRLRRPLPPGRYRATVRAAGRVSGRASAPGRPASVRFRIATKPANVAAAARSAERFLLRAQRRGGGFGSDSRAASASLFTASAAAALAAPGRGPRAARALVRARRWLAAPRHRPRSLPELERSILPMARTHRLARRWRAALARRQLRNGSFGADLDLTAYAVLALETGGRRFRASVVRRARAWLRHKALPAGGFGRGAPEVDTTGAVLRALGRAAPRSALRFLASAQNPDGGLPARPGLPSNAQSTALAVLGLTAAGRDPRRLRGEDGITPLDYLRARSGPGGAVRYADRDRRTPVWVTAQALLALRATRKEPPRLRRSGLLASVGRTAPSSARFSSLSALAIWAR